MESEHEMQLALPCIGVAGINSFHIVLDTGWKGLEVC